MVNDVALECSCQWVPAGGLLKVQQGKLHSSRGRQNISYQCQPRSDSRGKYQADASCSEVNPTQPPQNPRQTTLSIRAVVPARLLQRLRCSLVASVQQVTQPRDMCLSPGLPALQGQTYVGPGSAAPRTCTAGSGWSTGGGGACSSAID
jgi:hypothetical protein